MNKVMVDIETMSTHNTNAVILSVAVCKFNLHDLAQTGMPEPHVGSEVLWVLDIKEQLLLGRRIDPATQEFWAKQPREASDHWRNHEGSELSAFKHDFERYLEGVEELWANGILFDLGNIASLWPEPPWHYRLPRDARTVYRLIEPRADRPELDPDPAAHDPRVDVRRQVYELWRRTAEKPPSLT